MQPSAPAVHPLLRTVLALAITSMALATGCGGGKEAATAPASAAHTGGSKAEAPAAKAVPEAPKAAETPAVASTETASPAASSLTTPAETAPASGKSAADKASSEPVAASPAEKTAAPPLSAASGAKPGAAAAQEKAAHDKSELAKKLGDPLSQEANPNSKAKLSYEFGSDSKNFQKCMQGDVLNHTFQLQAGGEEDLVIKQAKPTCGCTVAQVSTQAADGSMAPYNFGSPIPPGRKIEITATLHTQNKRGHVASRINIFSNDPRGQTQLGLEADVDPFFLVNPANLNFNALSARDTAHDKVTITTSRGEKVKMTAGLDNLPQGMKLELTPSEPDADGKSSRWELTCNLGPGLVEGNLAYTAAIKSDIPIPGGEKLPTGADPTYEVTVPVMARVTGMISYTPAFVSLGLIRPGQVVSRTLRITSHDPEFKLAEPKVLVQGREGGEWDLANRFSTVIRPVSGENSIDVELRLDGMPDTLNGSFSGQLVIQIGHPEKPEIKLPITGVCRGGAAGTPVPVGQTPAPPK